MGSTSVAIPIQRIEAGQQIAGTCVQFGFCTSVCPTYVLDGEENDSPRGRIALIEKMLDDGGAPDPATVTHVDRCLSCLSCTTTCAAGVNYRELADTAREYIEASKVRPLPDRLWRALLMNLMLSPRLLAAAQRLSRPWLPRLARSRSRLGAMARVNQAPALQALRAPSTVEAAHPAAPVRSRVALLEGCVQSATGPEINHAAKRLLARLGVAVVPPPTRPDACCGALPLHMGQRARARQLAIPLIEGWHRLLKQNEIDAIVITTSGCGSVIKQYAELFEPHEPMRQLAEHVAQNTLDISEYIARLAPEAKQAHLGARVAYHDACSLKHGQRITQPPRRVLQQLDFEVLEPGESHLCCGSAGTYNLLQPEIADRLGSRKANNLQATQPDVIVAGNLGCLVQVSRFTAVPVAHWVQLVDWATGGPAPVGLETFQPRERESDRPHDDTVAWQNTQPHQAATTADPASPDAFW